ncbi:TIGR03084 family metal-binding protein [Variovorax saccharolyticus]|uniref:TIGR03084 family metal-binding protein n=1 Tax=Variovorax saccharolyticus TaxID=3053516 RepID=UPI0025754659|nr:TIGR03084 family metal-binding protein [Variovorax sp. J22R187]MDM0018250.1 TIGR03084 family metal-binding protein [Variovorax sp. J22R187]
MKDTADDLRAEYGALADLCRTLAPAQWRLASHFHGWTPWDEIAHLCYFDETATLSATDAEAFARDTAALTEVLAAGREISAIARDKYGHLDGAALLAHWEPIAKRLTDLLAGLDPKARLPWYGPSMSARSFASARLMETWAHGQDVWDVVGRERAGTARLRHIAHIGVTTFGWSFVNRKQPVPAVVPIVELDAPDGEAWRWGDADSPEFVRGSALDFCLLVTQRRNLADTGLRCSDGSARAWLSIAQCFAGPPADAPAPGVRKVVRATA